jgi:hypothetical protein
MLSQVVYQTNADYFDSVEAMAKNPLVVSETTAKGILTFRFVESKTVFLLSPQGKLQVKWNDISEKRTLYKLVKSLLVVKGNEKIVIKPLKQQAWIDYPVPDSFKLYWCDVATEYILKKPESESVKQSGVPKVKNEAGAIKHALDDLRREFRFLREPTLNEVALRSGCLRPRTLKNQLETAGWRDSKPSSFEFSAEEAIELASWIRLKEKGTTNNPLMANCNKIIESATLSNIEKARTLLQAFPELIPEADMKDLVWPEETKKVWRQVFGTALPAEQRAQRELEGARFSRTFFGDGVSVKTIIPFLSGISSRTPSRNKEDTSDKTA